MKNETIKEMYDRLLSHSSDCSTHNMPAYPNGPCDCGVQDIIDMANHGRHIHGAGKVVDIDTCRFCGHDLRHMIHKRSNEN